VKRDQLFPKYLFILVYVPQYPVKLEVVYLIEVTDIVHYHDTGVVRHVGDCAIPLRSGRLRVSVISIKDITLKGIKTGDVLANGILDDWDSLIYMFLDDVASVLAVVYNTPIHPITKACG